MENASSAASYAACNIMGSTNLLLETLSSFIKLYKSLYTLRDLFFSVEYRRSKGCYYDVFSISKDKEDVHANLESLEKAGIRDKIVEMLKRYELKLQPSDDHAPQLNTVYFITKAHNPLSLFQCS
ncbi:hypothetical protein Peur_032142 [Populus x canadensis]